MRWTSSRRTVVTEASAPAAGSVGLLRNVTRCQGRRWVFVVVEPNAGTDGTESSDGAAIGHSDSGAVLMLIQRVRHRVTSHGLMAMGFAEDTHSSHASTSVRRFLPIPRIRRSNCIQADPNTGVVSQFSLVTRTRGAGPAVCGATQRGDVGKKSGARSRRPSTSPRARGKADGSFGVELQQVSGQDGKPSPRFVMDGPRWFLRFASGQGFPGWQCRRGLGEGDQRHGGRAGNDAMPWGMRCRCVFLVTRPDPPLSRPPRPSAPPSPCRARSRDHGNAIAGRGLHHPAVIGRGGRNAFRVVPGRGRDSSGVPGVD